VFRNVVTPCRGSIDQRRPCDAAPSIWRSRLRRCVCSGPRLRSQEALDLGNDTLRLVDPDHVPRAWNPNEAKVRITRDDGLGVA
jgi:hypothetical protein